jgi:N-acetylglucosaminyl-diphospho-decaprenol L-rhamnosyltransferase
MTSVTAVVVHYGPVEPTVDLARRIDGYADEIVVVANDGRARPAGLPSTVDWIVADRNLGYGSAFTLAVRGRVSDAYLLLNTDIELPYSAYRRCLDVLLSTSDTGIVAPVLRYSDGTLQSGAARLSRWRRAPLVLVEPGPAPVECEWVTGAVMFIRREVAETVGMDGSFFLGGEDADLCVRARRAGWRVVCCGDAAAVHHRSQVITGPRWTYYSIRNRVWLARANFGPVPAILSWLGSALALPRLAVGDAVRRRNFSVSRLGVLALAHAWIRKPARAEGPREDEPLAGRVIRW